MFYPIIERLVQIYFGISKIGFQDLWISGVIEMMTSLNLFPFGDGGPIWTPIEELVQIRFSVQEVSKLSPLSKDAVKHRSLYLKPVSQIATVICTALYRWGSETLPHINLSSHFTTVAKVKILDLLWSRKSRRHKKSFSALALKRGVCFLCNQRPKSGRRFEW